MMNVIMFNQNKNNLIKKKNLNTREQTEKFLFHLSFVQEEKQNSLRVENLLKGNKDGKFSFVLFYLSPFCNPICEPFCC